MSAINRLTPTRWLSIALLAAACAAPAAAMAQSQMTPEMQALARKVVQACKADLKQYCQGIQPGGGRIAACLQANRANLTPSCQAALAEALPK
ncbi:MULTISPECIES: cysteine rich repeat-containing protein [Hyphomicrobiales]|uniref:Cysteine rich repeat-containing protein n=3 Tax=Hyphomicrobiales TaxID=356 RepID=A0A1T4LWB3_9HYPH|nr:MULTISPECIES: cysteine rich repeat-containing protein [Hyphomicrobiales]MDH1270641.1 cysteine rich repeat-containing protein [Agrobacterium pusense]RBO99222.1 cysteine rich repeat protein [Pseudochrobactrum asaccharolyticum]SJZ58975.1 Cysteine rich repeat-containing protein [Consotaella salsifontis]